MPEPGPSAVMIALGLLLLVSPGAAQVRVDGAQGDSLVIRCPVADCRPRLRLSATDSTRTVVTVVVDSLESADFTLLPVQWSLAGYPRGIDTVSVSARADANVALRATLPERGRYVSGVALLFGNTRRFTRLIIMRVAPATTLEVSGLAAVRARTGNVRFWLSLRDSSGRAQEIQSVEFDSLTRTAGGNKVQASFDRLTVGQGADCSSAPDTARGARSDGSAQPRAPLSLRVPPDGALRLTLCVDGLDDAGEYSGLLRISPVNGQPVTRAVTFTLKDGWLPALLMISLGIGLALALRRYIQTTRPRLRLTAQLQAIQARLDAARITPDDADGQAAITALRDRIAAILYDVEVDPAANVADRVATVDRQVTLLRSWAPACRLVDSIEPPHLRDRFITALATALATVRRDVPTVEQLGASEAALETLPVDVSTAVKAWQREQATAFLGEVIQYLAAAPASPQGDELRTIADEIRAALEALDTGQGDESRRRLDAARLKFVKLLVAAEKDAIDPARTPRGADKAKWPATAARLTALLDEALQTADPEEATRLYSRAYADHIDERAAALANYGKDQITILENRKDLAKADKDKYGKAIQDPLNRLGEVRKQSAAGQLREAATLLKQLEGDVDNAVQDMPLQGAALHGGTGPVAVATSFIVHPNAPAFAGALSADFQKNPLPTRPARDDLAWGEWLFLAAGALIAVLLGMKVLYADNATWGGATDLLTAFLWGLGITQSSGAAFEGFAALTARVTK